MFGFKRREQPVVHLLVDKDSRVLAKGELQGEPSKHNMQIRITEGLTDDVVEAGIIQAIPSGTKTPVLLGQIIMRRGNLVVVEPLRELDGAVRRNFRMPVKFDTFLYVPNRGGRYPIVSENLSCGGIAFFAAAPLETGTTYELVIPITLEGPLIVPCRILRSAPYTGPVARFAGAFDGIIDDEETLIREAVFNVQLETVRISKQKPRARK